MSGRPGADMTIGELEAEKAEFATAGEQVERKLAGLFPVGHMGGDLLLGEPAHALAQFFVLGGERRGRLRRALPDAARGLFHAVESRTGEPAVIRVATVPSSAPGSR